MRAFLFIAALLTIAGHAALAADLEAGKAKAGDVCSACHGEVGISDTPLVPSIASLPDEYIQYQLVYFRRGTRRSDFMEPVAADLSNDQIQNLAAYFSSLPPPKGATDQDNKEMREVGGKMAAALGCARCHGDGLVGLKAVPRIAGQREDYLLKALRDFKSNVRIGGGLAAMPETVFSLSDDQLQALAAYLSHL